MEELAKVTVSDMKDVPVEHRSQSGPLASSTVSSKQIDAQLDNLESLEANWSRQSRTRQKDELMRWIVVNVALSTIVFKNGQIELH